MATDSNLFRGRLQLESEGWQLEGNTFRRNEEEYLPLYEAKMTAPFDHRAADVVLSETALVRQGQSEVLDSIAHNNPKRLPLPRYWVARNEVLANIGNEKPIAFLGFTDVTSPTNERTMLATILPVAGVGHTKPLIFSKCEPPTTACLASNLNSFAFDYCARQKVGGIHFAMTSKLLPNGLSGRTNPCLVNAGIPINKRVVIGALKTGKLFPYCWPPNYGKKTHSEVCHWAGVDPETLPQMWPHNDSTPYPEIGISYRAWRCVRRSGIPADKKSVRHALRTGLLSPGRRPSNYGPQTHSELCRWAGVNPAVLAPVLAQRAPFGPGNQNAG